MEHMNDLNGDCLCHYNYYISTARFCMDQCSISDNQITHL